MAGMGNRQVSLLRAAIVTVCAVALTFSLTYLCDQAAQSPAVRVLSTVSATPEPDAMTAFAADREIVRRTEFQQIQTILDDDEADAGVKETARRKMLQLTDQMEQESVIEGVLRVRGYAQALATVHTDSVNVLIRTDALSQAEAAAVMDVAMRETGLAGGSIKIILVD